MSKLRLLLVDDHEIVRIGLKTMLGRFADGITENPIAGGILGNLERIQNRDTVMQKCPQHSTETSDRQAAYNAADTHNLQP